MKVTRPKNVSYDVGFLNLICLEKFFYGFIIANHQAQTWLTAISGITEISGGRRLLQTVWLFRIGRDTSTHYLWLPCLWLLAPSSVRRVGDASGWPWMDGDGTGQVPLSPWRVPLWGLLRQRMQGQRNKGFNKGWKNMSILTNNDSTT
jgi:hypothetical protein